MSEIELRVVDDPAAEAARLLVEAARAGQRLALSGGSSPAAAFERAAELEPDWGRAELWWGDERAVPPDDERSNYGLAEEHLLRRLDRQPAGVHRVHGELGAAAAADAYEQELDGVRLDLALNGIGPDGHTGSLFPGAPSLEERARQAIAAEPGREPWVDRITLTIPGFGGIPVLVYLVTGESKADAVRRAFAEEPSAETPASLVRGAERTVALLDRAAAAYI
jgi:6-phosphogluconolactonase